MGAYDFFRFRLHATARATARRGAVILGSFVGLRNEAAGRTHQSRRASMAAPPAMDRRSQNPVEVLPPIDDVTRERALHDTQVTPRSPMGAIIYETGGP